MEGENSDESDLAYLEDKESLDGDREEAEYVNSQGEEEVLSSAMTSALGNLVVNDADPASRDSMLLLDSDLESISDSDMEVDPASSVSYSSISNDTVSSSEDTEESQNQSDVQSRGRVRGKRRSRGRGASRGRGRCASRGRGRGASRGHGRQHGRGRRGRIVRNSNSNVDDDWKWENEYNDDTTISAPPEFEEDTGPKYEALECNEPYDFFSDIVSYIKRLQRHITFTAEAIN